MRPIETIIRLENGNLPAYAWPGGYPIYYRDNDGLILCPQCANNIDKNTSGCWVKVVYFAINYENEDLYCQECAAEIECAYE